MVYGGVRVLIIRLSLIAVASPPCQRTSESQGCAILRRQEGATSGNLVWHFDESQSEHGVHRTADTYLALGFIQAHFLTVDNFG